MSSSESELIVAFREEMRAGFALFAAEMRGFGVFATEMREGLTQVREGLAHVSSRLDRTNELLLETRTELKETRTEVSLKLNGISNFLILSEESHVKADGRLLDLEIRMKKLEKDKKRPS
jgi:septal ring factor EnvC (AmiA/AmiB activator)